MRGGRVPGTRVSPAGEGHDHAVDQALEAAVDVHLEAECAARFERDESVQGGPEGPDGVDGVITVKLVDGQDIGDDLHRGQRGGFVLGVPGAGRTGLPRSGPGGRAPRCGRPGTSSGWRLPRTGRQPLAGFSVAYQDAWEAIHPDEAGRTFSPRNPLVPAGEMSLELRRRIDYIMVRFGVQRPGAAGGGLLSRL